MLLMYLYRIVKNKSRTSDLSGTGAYRVGGRWNNKGTYMLYTSENSSLALLETVVHFDDAMFPPHLFIMQLEIDDAAPIYTVPDSIYPANWLKLELLENKVLGYQWMKELAYLGTKVISAVNTSEYNYLLNPLYPDYHKMIKIISVDELPFDKRLV
jgi:RES domain-containing protein